MNLKNLNRKQKRLWRLYRMSCLLNAFTHYSMFTHYSRLLDEGKKTYAEAEKASEIINDIFNKKTLPEDFINCGNELTNKIIIHQNEYERFVQNAELYTLNPVAMQIFCEYGMTDPQYSFLTLFPDFRAKVAVLTNYVCGLTDRMDFLVDWWMVQDYFIHIEEPRYFRYYFAKAENFYINAEAENGGAPVFWSSEDHSQTAEATK